MIVATDIELRVGARQLVAPVTFRIQAGDRIGLVGRNGAGKTTLLKSLAGERLPDGGEVTRSDSFGYLPQDTSVGDPTVRTLDHILSARGLADARRRIETNSERMAVSEGAAQEKAMRRYDRAVAEFEQAGGYAAEAEAKALAANLGLANKHIDQELGTLSGGQRRRAELARLLFAQSEILLLDEPTNHLDADSITWLRGYLQSYRGGFVVISHDTDLLADTVNQVMYLDANRGEIDSYRLSWKAYVKQRELDEKRRQREEVNAQKKAGQLRAQAERFRAKASKATAAKNMLRRADELAGSVTGASQERVAALRFPTPVPCGKVPLTASDLSKHYGSLEVFTNVNLAIDRGARVVVLGLNGAGKTTLLRILAEVLTPDTGEVAAGHGLKLGYYAQEHDNLDLAASVLDNMLAASENISTQEARTVLGSFLFVGDDVYKPASVLSGGEKTRLALAILVVSGANVLLLDEPTNNLDPASRAEILAALAGYEGAVVLVTHDEGAVEALAPQKVLILPEGDEDYWSADYVELITLA